MRTIRSMNICAVILSFALIGTPGFAQETKQDSLLKILGEFPAPPVLKIDTLESFRLTSGWRYKIEYIAEEANTLFDTPVDKIRAYLFVPDHKQGQELPAIVAIHQDGNPENLYLGKLETAGLGGSNDQHYGLELFQRGYVVICPDQFTHGERRRIPKEDQTQSDFQRDLFLSERWVGQLILSGRTGIGKRVYDLMRAVDVLFSLDFVDKGRIGAIAHSGGGNYLVYFMFVDKRIKVGASSCGFNDLLYTYSQNNQQRTLSSLALPGLAKVGRSADYLAFLAPRPFLLTRGLWEYGKENEIQKTESVKHVARTKEIEEYARRRYSAVDADKKFVAIYFEENNGYHSFPSGVKQEVYQWLDGYLKK